MEENDHERIVNESSDLVFFSDAFRWQTYEHFIREAMKLNLNNYKEFSEYLERMLKKDKKRAKYSVVNKDWELIAEDMTELAGILAIPFGDFTRRRFRHAN